MLKNIVCFVVILWSALPVTAISADDEETQPQSSFSVVSGEAVLSVNEPIYFIVGGEGDTTARFQLSFKYRILDTESSIVRNVSWLEGLHFAYTQTSLWNLSADSRPFEDSSYRPSLFLDFYTHKTGLVPAFIRTGYEHESNGQSGETSRSLNTLFIWPFWGGKLYGHDWIIAPKIYAYFSTGQENKDIDEYRGYSDLWFRYGDEDGWLLSSILRHGDKDRNMFQLDVSYPLRKTINPRTGGYLYMQLFHGYGESLLTYDEKQDIQFRIGFAIVR